MKVKIGWVPIIGLVIFSLFCAYIYARYLTVSYFPEITLMDLGAFYIMGLLVGLLAGGTLALTKLKTA